MSNQQNNEVFVIDCPMDTVVFMVLLKQHLYDLVGGYPDIWMSLDGPVRSLIVAEHPNNNKRSTLLEAAAKLPNFWHVVPAGTYRLGLSEEVFVVSHQ